MKLSVVLATRNEEENIGRCLESVKSIADEIVVVDEYSQDATRKIAEELGAKVHLEPHHEIFHITKQKAIDEANGEWVLQLDADEVVTPQLAKEIVEVINSSNEELINKKPKDEKIKKLFQRHQELIEKRDGVIGVNNGDVVAFFIPRLNIFLGRPLIHAGVYPDPAIRLIKKDKAYLPGKDVHEIMKINGQVSWLENYMEHYDSPTLRRYLNRLNRYTDIFAKEYKQINLDKSLYNFIKFGFLKPMMTFISLYLRHKGILDGVPGFFWSFFSALRFPISYFKYLTTDTNIDNGPQSR